MTGAGAPEVHRRLQAEAVELEGRGQRHLLAGEAEAARAAFAAAAERYRSSWEAAPPGGYGRLIGMVKAALVAGGGEAEATYAREAVGAEGGSAPASYVVAVAALVERDDAAAGRAAAAMAVGGPAFERTAAALDALARADGPAYREALEAVVRDFEGRDAHLTGVPVADTALMLERLAERRGLAARPASPVTPALP